MRNTLIKHKTPGTGGVDGAMRKSQLSLLAFFSALVSFFSAFFSVFFSEVLSLLPLEESLWLGGGVMVGLVDLLSVT